MKLRSGLKHPLRQSYVHTSVSLHPKSLISCKSETVNVSVNPPFSVQVCLFFISHARMKKQSDRTFYFHIYNTGSQMYKPYVRGYFHVSYMEHHLFRMTTFYLRPVSFQPFSLGTCMQPVRDIFKIHLHGSHFGAPSV